MADVHPKDVKPFAESPSQMERVDLNEFIESVYKSYLRNKLMKLNPDLRLLRKNETAIFRKNYSISAHTGSSPWDFKLVLCKTGEKSSEQPTYRNYKTSLKQAIESLHGRAKKYDETVTEEAKLGIAMRVLDLSEEFGLEDGIYFRRATHLLACYSKADERFAQLACVLKTWRTNNNHGLGKVGDLNSYPLVSILIQYLQTGCSPPVLPSLQDCLPSISSCDVRSVNLYEGDLGFVSKNEQTAGQLLGGFFSYIGLPFNRASFLPPEAALVKTNQGEEEGFRAPGEVSVPRVEINKGWLHNTKEAEKLCKSIHVHLHFN